MGARTKRMFTLIHLSLPRKNIYFLRSVS